ncbi:MAG: hypothetical protein C4308_00035 [Chitinophagaceae bacterium]
MFFALDGQVAQLFFVLSGYLITSILLREKQKSISTSKKFINFWGRRVLRIFPLYFLYLFMLIVTWLFFGELMILLTNFLTCLPIPTIFF